MVDPFAGGRGAFIAKSSGNANAGRSAELPKDIAAQYIA